VKLVPLEAFGRGHKIERIIDNNGARYCKVEILGTGDSKRIYVRARRIGAPYHNCMRDLWAHIDWCFRKSTPTERH